MSRRRVVRLALGLALLALAAAAALAAEDTRRWPDRLDRGDVTYQAQSVPFLDPWEEGDRLPLRLGARVLAVDDDLRVRRALHLVRRARSNRTAGINNPQWVRVVGRAQGALVKIEDDDADRARRSAAANLLGYLYYQGAQSSGAAAQFQFVRAALDSFRRAVLLDGRNDDAKYNLELLMARMSQERRRVPQTRFGAARERGQGGATLNPRGSGY